jgi:alpha-L-fucosidase
MDKPAGDIRITSLGKTSELINKKVRSVSILGVGEKAKWKQEEDALVIFMPTEMPDWKVIGIRIGF